MSAAVSTPAPVPEPAGHGRRPRILVIGTGGTIAGSAAGAEGRHYVSGELPVHALVAAVPALAEVAELTSDELFRIDSVEMDLARQLLLARRVAAALADPDVDGVVVTHGTDTLEESAYFLHLTVATSRPVVLVGAMRPADATSADGPGNLLNAVRVAATPEAARYGVLVVVGDEIHGARDLRKQHTTRVNAFGSAHGPLGEVGVHSVTFRSLPTRRSAGFDVLDRDELPAVEVVVTHAGQPPAVLEAVCATGVRGLVNIGPGAGNVPEDVAASLDAARRAGVVVVRCTRVGSGAVRRNEAVDDDAHDWVAGDDLSPYKARILLSLALTATDATAELQTIFDTF